MNRLLFLVFTLSFKFLFATTPIQREVNDDLFEYLEGGKINYNNALIESIRKSHPDHFVSRISINDKMVELNFKKNTPKYGRFDLLTSSGKVYQNSESLIYTLENANRSLSGTLQIKPDQCYLVAFGKDEKFIFSSAKNGTLSHERVDMTKQSNYNLSCETSDEIDLNTSPKNPIPLTKSSELLTLNVYFEVDYHIFQSNNSDIELTMLWLQQHVEKLNTLFVIHNIEVKVSEVFIWDSPDPYRNISLLSDLLAAFGQNVQNDFQGHTAQLLVGRTVGGGLAHLDKLCSIYSSQDHSGPYSVAGNINTSDVHSPNYDFSTFVSAHEIGHVIGSPHSHACVWGPNGNQALDDCFATEGGCPKGPTPQNGGSLMSYCFMKPEIGVNFTHGFGDEPGTLIYNKLYSATCGNTCIVNSPCNDEDPCTANDVVDENCNCIGELIDLNFNNICDLVEDCQDEVYLTSSSSLDTVLAQQMISSTAIHTGGNKTIYSAAINTVLNGGFEIPANKEFEIYSYGCNTIGN